jgi:hypothetical protein
MTPDVALSLLALSAAVASVCVNVATSRAHRQAREQRAELERTLLDFVQRVHSGLVQAVTSEGLAGTLVVEPWGEHGLRVRVEPHPAQSSTLQ